MNLFRTKECRREITRKEESRKASCRGSSLIYFSNRIAYNCLLSSLYICSSTHCTLLVATSLNQSMSWLSLVTHLQMYKVSCSCYTWNRNIASSLQLWNWRILGGSCFPLLSAVGSCPWQPSHASPPFFKSGSTDNHLSDILRRPKSSK